MIKRTVGDTISIDEFAYNWRINDAHWDKLSDDLLRQILPLSAKRVQEVMEAAKSLYHPGPYMLRTENYHAKSQASLETDTPGNAVLTNEWLSSLPIASDEEIYVCWLTSDAAVITSWGIFKHVWESLWYPFDFVAVFDETLNWAVLLGREEIAVYAERDT